MAKTPTIRPKKYRYPLSPGGSFTLPSGSASDRAYVCRHEIGFSFKKYNLYHRVDDAYIFGFELPGIYFLKKHPWKTQCFKKRRINGAPCLWSTVKVPIFSLNHLANKFFHGCEIWRPHSSSCGLFWPLRCMRYWLKNDPVGDDVCVFGAGGDDILVKKAQSS